jgi:hypothetical protein
VLGTRQAGRSEHRRVELTREALRVPAAASAVNADNSRLGLRLPRSLEAGRLFARRCRRLRRRAGRLWRRRPDTNARLPLEMKAHVRCACCARPHARLYGTGVFAEAPCPKLPSIIVVRCCQAPSLHVPTISDPLPSCTSCTRRNSGIQFHPMLSDVCRESECRLSRYWHVFSPCSTRAVRRPSMHPVRIPPNPA